MITLRAFFTESETKRWAIDPLYLGSFSAAIPETTATIWVGLQGTRESELRSVLYHYDRCDSVTLRVTNTDTQAHGLAVSIYAVPGLTVAAGQTLSLSFTAYKAGQFRVYCTIICTVHDYMQNGQFNVT